MEFKPFETNLSTGIGGNKKFHLNIVEFKQQGRAWEDDHSCKFHLNIVEFKQGIGRVHYEFVNCFI